MESVLDTIKAAMLEFESTLSDIPFRFISERDAQISVFFSYCRLSETGCWLWTGKKNAGGYGYLKNNAAFKGAGRGKLAHRWSHELFIGPIPHGLHVLHSCDIPACANPAHLRAGTRRENVHDCISRGRFRPGGLVKPRRGSDNNLAKLTDVDVIDIRNSTLSPKDLSVKYGIDRTNIHQIIAGKTWTHVPMPEKRVEKSDGRAKLTRDQVMAIKSADASIPHSQLSRQYGVGVPLVSMIRNGRIWKSVTAAAQE